jgi:hypothetical protein
VELISGRSTSTLLNDAAATWRWQRSNHAHASKGVAARSTRHCRRLRHSPEVRSRESTEDFFQQLGDSNLRTVFVQRADQLDSHR